jgi:hypothetical protein
MGRLLVLAMAVICLAWGGPASTAAGPTGPPPPPLDSDGDGKPDDVDDCPGRHGQTPSGCPDAYPPDENKPRLTGNARSCLRGASLRVSPGTASEDMRGLVTVRWRRLKLSKTFRARPDERVVVSHRLKPKRLSALQRHRRVRLTVRVTARDPAGHTSSKTLKVRLRP